MSDAIGSIEQEIELKLVGTRRDIAALGKHKILCEAFEKARVRHLRSTYFDTPDLALQAHGYGLRLCRDAATGKVRQTLKHAPAAATGLFQRDEWEVAVAGEYLDRDALAQTPLAALLENDDPASLLGPVFVVETERRAAQVKIGDSIVEVCLDQGAVIADSARTAIDEVELELISGRTRDLFDLAAKLASRGALRPGLNSKAAVGYALRAGTKPEPVKAIPAGVGPHMSTGEAFAAIAQASLHQIIANEAALVEARDPGAVHQMRVATRRLRAAITLFRPAIRDRHRKTIAQELRWLAKTLGDARELDVFIEKDVARIRRKRPRNADAAELAAHFDRERDAAYARVIEMLTAKRYRSLLLDTLAWIHCGAWRRRKACRTPVSELASRNLAKRTKDVRRRARILSSLEVEERHDLRLDVKKLRYASEFFADIFASRDQKTAKRAAKFVKTLEEMQERLGDLNDAATSISITGRLDRNDAAQMRAARLIEEDHVGRAAKSLEAARDACAAFIKAKPFWK
jgi:triphosphatase